MLSQQAPIRVRELDWGAPAVAAPAEEEEALPGRGRPRGRGRGRGRPPRPWPPASRGGARGMSASQPEPELPSMLDDDGDIDFVEVLSTLAQHTLHSSGNIAAYSAL